MIDSHCHLDFDVYNDDLAAVLGRARAAGLSAMVSIGSGRDLDSARAAVALASREPDVFATVGIHPHDVAAMQEGDWDELSVLARSDKVVGVGETGLDYHYDHSPRDVQRQAFVRFISLAVAVRRPVVSHVRDAHGDAADILATEAAKMVGGVIHSFTGTVEDARRYLDLGQHLSFSGILTFKSAADLRAAAAFAPLDRILVETDSPYLTPVPHRGKRNEPALVQHTVATLAAVRGISPEDAARATSENARRLFKLD